MKKLFLLSGIFLLFASCKKNEAQPALTQDSAINAKVNELYTTYGKSNEAIYNQSIPEDLFSEDLKKVLEEAINTSKADIEKVKNSDHPDEKPLIFEGAVFSSLYEGFTAYKIKSVRIKDTTAKVPVAFEYNLASPKVAWTDTIYLTNTGKEWKIDNITFDTIGNSRDLKARLKEFVKSTIQ